MSSGDTPNKHSIENLDQMSRDDLVELGTNLDASMSCSARIGGPSRAPAPRSARSAMWQRGSSWPASQVLRSSASTCSGRGNTRVSTTRSTLVQPLHPAARPELGLSILGIGVGAVQFTKKFIPEEVSIQDRHDGPSSEVDRKTIVAELADSLETSTLTRRKLVKRTAIFGGGALASD